MTTPLWQDRRGMFQKGREVHTPSSPTERRSSIGEAVRRASTSSTDGTLEKTTSNTSSGGASSPTADRRRSSNAGLFGNLTTHKRGSADYSDRRASHSEQAQAGVFSGWYNKTFRGMTPAQAQQQANQQEAQK